MTLCSLGAFGARLCRSASPGSPMTTSRRRPARPLPPATRIFKHGARVRRRNLDRRLVGLDLHERLVLVHGLPLGDEPACDFALRQALAEIGQLERASPSSRDSRLSGLGRAGATEARSSAASAATAIRSGGGEEADRRREVHSGAVPPHVAKPSASSVARTRSPRSRHPDASSDDEEHDAARPRRPSQPSEPRRRRRALTHRTTTEQIAPSGESTRARA